MQSTTNADLLVTTFKIGDINSQNGMWMYYDETNQALKTTRVNSTVSYIGDFINDSMTPSQLFIRQTYPTLSFSLDFVVGSNTTLTSQRLGLIPLSLSSNKIYMSYKPPQLTDIFTFVLYSADNSVSKKFVIPITVSSVDVVPTVIQGNPTINTLNNKYTGLTMLFSEGGVDAGTLTTSSSQSSVSNVVFSNGSCTFDYTTPTTEASDNLIFTSLRAADIQVVNTSPHSFQISNLLEEPHFSNWIYTPASQTFSYTGVDSLIAVFNKNISTCTSITASSGTPTTIIPTSIIGTQVKFEWTSLTTGNVTFTFNGLTSTDGSIDASVDGLTVAGPILLNAPPTIVSWNGPQPTEANTLYNLSVNFDKQLSNSRIPVITVTEGVIPSFISVNGSQVNFTVTTSSTPSSTIYSLKKIYALDGSIRSADVSISAGAKINSVDVETDLTGSFLTMSNLVIGRTQKVKIILSKPISGTLSFLPNTNCTFGAVTMINSSTAQFNLTPLDNGLSSLTIQTSNLVTQDGGVQSTLSYVFNLIYGQTIVNLFESSNTNNIKTIFDVGTLVTLSLQVSKPISSDLTGTSITCSNGTVSTLSSSTILGKYYYNFNFTPTVAGTSLVLYLNQAKDLNNFKYSLSYSELTFTNPYVFPTSFNFSSTNNGFTAGAYLKSLTSSPLVMTFTGGDLLHSNIVSSQISYVKYVQDSIETVIAFNDLSCSSTSNTVTITSITPATSSALTVKIQLKAPNGSVGTEITGTVTADKFEQPPNSIMTTSGLVLWLDGADPLATGSTPADGADISKWWDKSVNNRHANAESVVNPKFASMTQNGRGAISFYGIVDAENSTPSYYSDVTQNLKISSFTFPVSSYTIFAVFYSVSTGAILSPFRGAHLMYISRGLIASTSNNGNATPDSNTNNGNATPDPNTNIAYNLTNIWTVGSMVVNGSTCRSFVNSLSANTPSSGVTDPFDSLIIGSGIYNSPYDYFSGKIGEIVIFNSALSDTVRLNIEYDLGVKWDTWPYNVSPLWNVVDWTTTKAFGDEFNAFVNTDATNWGTVAYWQWIKSAYDISLMGNDQYGNTLSNVHINMQTPGKLQYLLNNPTTNSYYDMKPATDDVWAIRWGYKNAQKPTHIGLGCQFGTVSANAVFTLTGFATSDFTSGTVLATLDGTAYLSGSCKWTHLTVIDSFKYFEFRQTVGPFLVGIGQTVRLGRGNFDDVSGMGSVAKSNLVCWLDGSDPYVTGQEIDNGTAIVKMFDKSMNNHHATRKSPTLTSVMVYNSPLVQGTSKGVLNVVQSRIVSQIQIAFQNQDFPLSAYTICMFCKATPHGNNVDTCVLASTGNDDIGYFLGAWGGKYQVTNSIYGAAGELNYLNTKRTDGSWVTFPFGSWVFICMVSVDNTCIPYINGVKLNTMPNSTPVIDVNKQILNLFGTDSYGYSAFGSLGEFGVYNKALSDSEISTLNTNLSTKFNVPLSAL